LNTVGQNGGLGLNGGFRTDAFPAAAANPANGTLYVVFNDNTGTPDRGDIFFTSSADHGQHWTVPHRVNDDNTQRDQWGPGIAVTPDGHSVFVGFYDRRMDPANALIDYFGAIGQVNGANVAFGNNFRITTQPFPVVLGAGHGVVADYMGDYDHPDADNNAFLASWGDNRLPDAFFANQPDVRFSRVPTNFNPPPVVPPGGNPPAVGPNAVFSCSEICPNLNGCYGVGILSTHPQFCAFNTPGVVPVPVPPSQASDTGLTVQGSGQHIFHCNQVCPNLGACYGIGELTTHPQFCSIAGPAIAPAAVPASQAVDTGLTIPGGQHVFRCRQLCPNLGACYGIGVLTTHAQFCSIAGPQLQPSTVPPARATDTGIKVP
jgi:hypothetical protein